jgi:hypothetical protein
MDFVAHIEACVEKAEAGVSNLCPEILALEGMSGLKTRHLYNNLVAFDGARYLEIGCWKGSTLAAAMYLNNAKIVAIDDFSDFEDGTAKKTLLDIIETYKGSNSVRFLEKDCFQVDSASLPKFNIYMYDGDHSKESHFKALTHYYNCLDDTFIFIVDDWNWQQVKTGTIEAIHTLNLKVLHKIQIESDSYPDKEGYWNGVLICVLQKAGAHMNV